MREVYEHRRVTKQLSRLPIDLLKRYEKWKDIARISGPSGLRLIKGFHDESLRGEWRGHRSSCLNQQYRVIYRVATDRYEVRVIEVTARDYRRSWTMSKNPFRRAKKTVEVSVGESVRMVRELQGLSQNQLAQLTGLKRSTISGLAHDRVNLGVERAKVLARALRCFPAVLVFPGWELETHAAA